MFLQAREFLDVYIRVIPRDDFCGASSCKLTYALALLTQSQFDLQVGHFVVLLFTRLFRPFCCKTEQ